jgi:HEAT repeat protein
MTQASKQEGPAAPLPDWLREWVGERKPPSRYGPFTGTHRHQAATALRQLGPDARGACEQRAIAARDEDRLMRMEALGALANLGAPAVPVLCAALSDEDSCVRSRAVEALAAIGPEARAAVLALVRLLDDPVKYVREDSRKALDKIQPEVRRSSWTASRRFGIPTRATRRSPPLRAANVPSGEKAATAFQMPAAWYSGSRSPAASRRWKRALL